MRSQQQRTRIGLWAVSLLTALVGIVNLLSAVTPNLAARTALLKQFFLFGIRAGGHIFAALSGFVLLTLAANLLRRKRVGLLLIITISIISIISHLVKGLDYEESLLSGVLLIQLLLMRNAFTAQPDRPYGTAGFYLLERQYQIDFSFVQALLQTLAMFFTEDNAGLTPKTRFGQFFANSIYIVGAATAGYAVFMLLRPVLLRDTDNSRERKQAQAIVEQYGRSSLARFTLFDDKAYYFSPSGRSVIAYVAKGRGAIALGDPIGTAEDRTEAIIGFQQFCNRNIGILSFTKLHLTILNYINS